MIEILVSGKLLRDPRPGTGKNGNPFCSALIKTDDHIVSAVAFGEASEKLGKLKADDAVALAGPAKLNSWVGKDGATNTGLSMVVTGVLSLFEARKRRGAVSGDSLQTAKAKAGVDTWETYKANPTFNDPIDF